MPGRKGKNGEKSWKGRGTQERAGPTRLMRVQKVKKTSGGESKTSGVRKNSTLRPVGNGEGPSRRRS